MAEDDKQNEKAIVRLGNRGLSTRSATLVRRGLEQSAILSPSPGNVWTNSIGMELVYIPPGEFMMGASVSEIDNAVYEAKKNFDTPERDWFSNELPKHKVVIRDGFWMGKYQVTQEQWQNVMGENPSYFKDNGANCPVERVSWDDIQAFLKRLDAKNDGFVYSLPTEAQWEYAARAGTTGDYYGNLDDIAWYYENSGHTTHPVGQKEPNLFGLYDMLGNVWEWCEDIYNDEGYDGLPTDGSANVSMGNLDLRVLRSGSWNLNGGPARFAVRISSSPSARNPDVGFRIVARPM